MRRLAAAGTVFIASIDRFVALDGGDDVVVMPDPLGLVLTAAAAQPGPILTALNLIPITVLQLSHAVIDLPGQMIGFFDQVVLGFGFGVRIHGVTMPIVSK